MSELSKNSTDLSPLKQALLALDEMQSKLEASHRKRNEPIAIIGMGCRFPGGADNPDAMWRILSDGVDVITEVPSDRWDLDEYYDPDPDAPGKVYTRYGGFLEDIDKFDAHFFGISPREAVNLDPQQRLLLEVSWEALENAGLSPDNLVGSQTGVFVGVMEDDYSKLHIKSSESSNLGPYYVSGNHLNFTAGRISYVLGLHGPSMAVDTACSSSLVAVHLASQNLRLGESNLALAAGVNLLLSPELTISMCKYNALSADGRCKTFDAAADGFGQSEGCGVLVLKRLSDAVADRDNILALIRGSAINHDGASSGLTVPNGLAQQKLIKQALINAGIQPDHVSFVEAHGTGTSLGDPIELRALDAVLSNGRAKDQLLMVGSAKTNFGHMASAAGMVGMMKVVLSLQHKEIPPSIHFNEINPHIPLDEMLVEIPHERTVWPSGNGSRVAGVSSFGLSGTNAHVVLEEMPGKRRTPPDLERPLQILALSGKSEEGELELVRQYARYLKQYPTGSIGDICYVANNGRSHFSHRHTVIAESAEQMSDKLAEILEGKAANDELSGYAPASEQTKIAFLFTGQGSQYVGMGQQLYETQPTFRKSLDECAEILIPYLEQPLLSVLFTGSGSSPLLDETVYTQPALFALEYALAKLWHSWGIEPSVAMGHSVGEYVAACIAGVFGLEDGLMLIAERGRLMQSLPKDGMMAVVFSSIEDINPVIAPYKDYISIAAVNGPQNVVISGGRNTVQSALDDLKSQGVRTQSLNVSHAFHSPLMEPILEKFFETAQNIQYFPPQIPLLSNITGHLLEMSEIPDASYWQRHIREPVRFLTGIETLHEQGYKLFLEVGPAPTLLGMARRCTAGSDHSTEWLPSLRKNSDDWQNMLESLGKLYVRGHDIDWKEFDRDYARGFPNESIPTYPFQRERFWLQPDRPKQIRNSQNPLAHPLLGQQILSPIRESLYEAQITTDWLPYLKDHRVFDMVVMPGTAFLEMALVAGEESNTGSTQVLGDVRFHEAFVLTDTDVHVTQLILSSDDSGSNSFQIYSLDDDDDGDDPGWTLHASGNIRSIGGELDQDQISFEDIQTRCQEELLASSFYQQLVELGLDYGPSFRGIEQIWRGDREVLGKIRMPGVLQEEVENYHLHPAILDACLQSFIAIWYEDQEQPGGAGTYLPVGLGSFRFYGRSSTLLWSHARLHQSDELAPDSVLGDLTVFDESGRLVLEIKDQLFKRIKGEDFQSSTPQILNDWLYEVEWLPQERQQTSETTHKGTWLVFAGEDGLSREFTALLEENGQQCLSVYPGEAYRSLKEGQWLINPSKPEDFRQLLDDVLDAANSQLNGVIHLWGLESQSDREITVENLVSAQEKSCGSVLNLVQALVSNDETRSSRLWLVTQAAQPVGTMSAPLNVSQSPLWGFGKVIAREHPELRCGMIDLDHKVRYDEVQTLFNEIWADDQENQVAFRDGKRYVARLVHPSPLSDNLLDDLPITDEQSYRLDIKSRGSMDNIEFQPVTRHIPEPGDVEIEVLAAGLNFRDVLNVLGLYPGDAGPLGRECAGKISTVGEGVKDFQVGDNVVAVAAGSFGKFVTTKADLVVAKPDQLNFEEAATIPIAFLTAYFGLHNLANIKPGDKVLIHAAAGGVGIAAVQLAQRAGAEVFATASSGKWAFLETLGVQNIMNSRSLEFADQIMISTDNAGVDIVLNSLSDEFIPKSVSVLSAKGRFLEIGKRDIWDEEQVARLKPDVTYFAYDLADLIEDDPASFQSIFRILMEAFTDGSLKPLPRRTFPIQNVVNAFRYMAQARHIGKIVLTQYEQNNDSVDTIQSLIRSDGTYLITGGLGGLGLQVARWLVGQGAQSLVLVGRSAPSEEVNKVIAELIETGIKVVVSQADVTHQVQVARILVDIEQLMPPLRGVVHSAGVLDDGMLLQQTWDRFDRVMSPKIAGSWHLHKLTQNIPLDFFVLFSSTASMIGSTGQGNYASANAFLDSLAHHRQALGLPGLSINWGPWADVGMVSSLSNREQRRLVDQGMRLISSSQGLQVFGKLLHQASPQIGVLSIDWMKYSQFFPVAMEVPLLKNLVPEIRIQEEIVTPETHVQKFLSSAEPAELKEMYETSLREMAAKVLRLPVARVDVQQPLSNQGLDSLMTAEFFANIEKTLGKKLPLSTLIEAPTIQHLTDILNRDKHEISWSSLVEMQPGGSNPPLFLIHGAGGNILLYRDLVQHLGPDQPVYGLQAQGLDGEQPILTRIEDMAALYLKEVQAVQPHGPYLIGGYCMGGTIALEMAQQLYDQGKDVALLALFETYNWAQIPERTNADKVNHLIQKIEFHARNFLILDPNGKAKFVQEKFKVARSRSSVLYGMLMSKFGKEYQQDNGKHISLAFAELWEINDQISLDYEPREYPGRITHYRPVKQYSLHDSPAVSWDDLAAEGVDTCTLPVYPAGMLVEPFVDQLAVELKASIDDIVKKSLIRSNG